jgi:hypothetical protein
MEKKSGLNLGEHKKIEKNVSKVNIIKYINVKF